MLLVHVMCWKLIEGKMKGSELRCCGALGGMNLQAWIRARWDNGSFSSCELGAQPIKPAVLLG